jgi:uncharacterized protein YcfJ
MKNLAILAAICGVLGMAAPASAGCVTGALVGGVVGHMAGHHGMAGAAAGCAIGHHSAVKKQERADQQMQSGTNMTH